MCKQFVTMNATRHDAYAADYDSQVKVYACYLADLLFGLCYEFSQPGQVLLDAGIGSGLSAQLFAKAGLKVYGMDFSPAMLALCRDKDFAVELKQHDMTQVPWPYPAKRFDQLVCCGVLHFIPDLESIFGEVRRVLRERGLFAFTTKAAPLAATGQPKYDQQTEGGFAIFSHMPTYIEALLASQTFTCLKRQNCCVGDDIFALWVIQKN